MANTKYLRCERCGCDALPRKYNAQTGQLSETGTSTLMRCPDCCNKAESARGYATMCRDCCPTGHQTHGGLDWRDPYPNDIRKAILESMNGRSGKNVIARSRANLREFRITSFKVKRDLPYGLELNTGKWVVIADWTER